MRTASDPARAALRSALLAAALALSAISAGATPADRGPSMTRENLLEELGRARSRGERDGLALQAFYNQFLGARPRGGRDPGDGLGLSGSYDVFVQLDLERAAGFGGLEMLLQVKGSYGSNVNPEVGAFSDPVDDADFDEALYLEQLWIQQSVSGGWGWLRLGFTGLGDGFDRNRFAGSEDFQFSAAALDNNPLVPLHGGLAALLVVRPTARLDVALGVADADQRPRHAGFDTAFDGFASLSSIVEVSFGVGANSSRESRVGRYRIGAFRDGRDLAAWGRGDESARRGHYGVYLSADQDLLGNAAGRGASLSAFLRLGWADPRVHPARGFASGGLSGRGLVPGRPRDVTAWGVYWGAPSAAFRAAAPGPTTSEIGFELYHRWEWRSWLSISPHLLFIHAPRGEQAARDAIVALLRLRLAL